MIKKALLATAVIGGAMLAAAAPASAGDEDRSGPGAGISIANNLCAAPWHWEGPLNILTGGDTSYVACNGNSAG